MDEIAGVGMAQAVEGDIEWEPEDGGMGIMLDNMASADILKNQDVKADTQLGQFGLDLAQGAGQLAGQATVGLATGGYGAMTVMGLQIMARNIRT